MKYKNSYIICTTPRSGSTLLCDLLTSTNVAGRPDSFFMNEFYSDWASYLNVSVANWSSDNAFDQSYLDAVLSEGTGETQVFGMRLQAESLKDLSKQLGNFYPENQSDSGKFRAAFGTSNYIHLSRKDKIAQAVSLLRAQQSGLWHVHSDGTERERLSQGHTPVYDGKALSNIIDELQEYDDGWKSWFTQQKIHPVSITYEDLSAAPQAVVAEALTALDLDPIHAQTIQAKTAKLSNSESDEWAQRFRKEQHQQSI